MDEVQAKDVFPDPKGSELAEHRHNKCRIPDDCTCSEHEMDFMR